MKILQKAAEESWKAVKLCKAYKSTHPKWLDEKYEKFHPTSLTGNCPSTRSATVEGVMAAARTNTSFSRSSPNLHNFQKMSTKCQELRGSLKRFILPTSSHYIIWTKNKSMNLSQSGKTRLACVAKAKDSFPSISKPWKFCSSTKQLAGSRTSWQSHHAVQLAGVTRDMSQLYTIVTLKAFKCLQMPSSIIHIDPNCGDYLDLDYLHQKHAKTTQDKLAKGSVPRPQRPSAAPKFTTHRESCTFFRLPRARP